ncbi:hypothetical protein [uncultured Neglectibacter sp.]|uniref:hypothetical protein n=1 Tax=uncultured Neglectibacter sp. TaxID=1924108 RepID=UPI0034DF47A0
MGFFRKAACCFFPDWDSCFFVYLKKNPFGIFQKSGLPLFAQLGRLFFMFRKIPWDFSEKQLAAFSLIGTAAFLYCIRKATCRFFPS